MKTYEYVVYKKFNNEKENRQYLYEVGRFSDRYDAMWFVVGKNKEAGKNLYDYNLKESESELDKEVILKEV